VLQHEAWMNIEIDEQVKWKVSSDGCHEQLCDTPFKGWICSIEGKQIVKNLAMALWKQLNDPLIWNHLVTKQQYPAGAEKDIDWNMTEIAMHDALPRAKQQ